MKKLFTLIIALSMILAVNAVPTDRTAAQSGLWSATTTWVDGVVPLDGDNVITNNKVITVDVNATITNLMCGVSPTTAALASTVVVNSGITLTIKGKVDAYVASDVDLFNGSHATSKVVLTGEALLTPFVMVTDLISKSFRPKNLDVAAIASTNQYQIATTTASTNTINVSAGKTTIKSPSKVKFGCRLNVGKVDGTNEFIIESGAEATTVIVEGAFEGVKIPAAKVTINGTLIANDRVSTRILEMGALGVFKTGSGSATTAHDKWWDGWWNNGNVTNPVGYGQFATPISLTLASGSTIEFIRTGSGQNVIGTVPENKIYTSATGPTFFNLGFVYPAQAIPYKNISISGGNTKTIQSNLTYSGTLTVASGTTLVLAPEATLTKVSVNSIRLSAPTLTFQKYVFGSGPSATSSFNVTATGLSGNLTVTGSMRFEVSTDNITFGSTATLTPPSGSLNNVPVYYRIGGGKAVGIYNESITIAGGGLDVTLTIPVFGMILTASPANYTWDGGGGADTKWTNAANWNPDRSTTNNTDIMIFDGGTRSVTDVPTLAIGQLKLINNAAVTLTRVGSNNQTISILGDDGDDLSIGTGSSLILSGVSINLQTGTSGNISGTLTNPVHLNVAAGSQLTNSGTITNNGAIAFFSDATNGTATFTGTAISGGTVSVTQSLQQASGAIRTWYVSSPVAATIAPTPTLSVIKSFNETLNDPINANNWITSTTLAPKVGYMVTPAFSTNNLLFSGAFNSGTQPITLTSRTGTANYAGFNLIGNPYPSYLDWKSIWDYTTDEGVTYPNRTALRSSTMWYRTRNAGVFTFWTMNGEGVGSHEDASVKIPPMQAFWVRAVAGGSTLNLTDAMRSHSPASNKLLRAPALNDRTLVRLQVSNGVNADEAVVYFSENAQNDIDNLDAPKMSNGNLDIPEIFTTLGTEKIVINSMNTIPLDTPIGVGFVGGSATSFSIKANEVSNLPEGVKLILKDNVTLDETDLTDGVTTYNFTPETTSADRFSLIFRTPGVTTDVDNTLKPTAHVYVNAANQMTIIAPEKSNYAIYNTIGQKLIEGITNANSTTLTLQKGLYVVIVSDCVKELTTKIIIN